jgi:hypothetical protein
MSETWKAIPGYEGIYEASTRGRIRSLHRIVKRISRHGNMCTLTIGARVMRFKPGGTSPYLMVTLSKEGIISRQIVHRLIALTFIPNPENKKEVNHLDGNKLNNKPDNLAWVTRSENTRHAMDNMLVFNKGVYNPYARAVTIDNGSDKKSFFTQREAAKYMGVKEGTLCAAKRNKRKLKGYSIHNA